MAADASTVGEYFVEGLAGLGVNGHVQAAIVGEYFVEGLAGLGVNGHVQVATVGIYFVEGPPDTTSGPSRRRRQVVC